MSLPSIGKKCKVEGVFDEDGTRLFCLTVDDCPLGHPGTLTKACFGLDSHVVVKPFGSRIKRQKTHARYGDVVKVNDKEVQEDSSYEPVEESIDSNVKEWPHKITKEVVEGPKAQPPKEPEKEETEDEIDEFAESVTVINEFESQNEYVFALDVIKGSEGDKYVQLTIDNVDITIPLEDFMELLFALAMSSEELQKILAEG